MAGQVELPAAGPEVLQHFRPYSFRPSPFPLTGSRPRPML